jgi:hypothetical protein
MLYVKSVPHQPQSVPIYELKNKYPKRVAFATKYFKKIVHRSALSRPIHVQYYHLPGSVSVLLHFGEVA